MRANTTSPDTLAGVLQPPAMEVEDDQQDTDPNDPLFGVDRGVQNITLDRITITRGNPTLLPTTAVSLDLSFEWYFGGGYLSAAVFDKDLKNIISTGDQPLGTVSLDGQTVNVVYNGQVNQSEASLHGFELAYQQFYDFLPGWLSHLGLQANYTNIQASADPPGMGVDANDDGVPEDVTQAFRFGVRDLLGQSEHIANLVGIYQDEKMEFRLAYNWRSEYLTTYRDWVTGNPIYADGGGFLDALENLEMSLAKSSMDIAERYLELVDDTALGRRVFGALRDEHDRGEAPPVRVVYHLVEGLEQASRGLEYIRNHLEADSASQIVVVAHATGVDFLMRGAKTAKGPSPLSVSTSPAALRAAASLGSLNSGPAGKYCTSSV